MLESILIAILVAKIRKLRIAQLFKEWPVYLIFIYSISTIFMNLSVFQGNPYLLKIGPYIKIIYIVIIAFLIIKYSLYKEGFIGVVLIALGGIMNDIVIKANGGRMPVFPTFSYITGNLSPEVFSNLHNMDSIHIQGSAATQLPYLSDVIDLGYTIMSIGDVFIISMVFLTIYGIIKRTNKTFA